MSIDFLKPVLGDELFAQFATAIHDKGLNLVNIADGSYIPKAKFDEKIAAVNQLTKDLAAAQQQVKDEQAKNAGVNELQAKIDQLTQDVAARDQQLSTVTMEHRIKDELRAAKARNADIVMPLLQRDKITDKDGKLEGFAEQVDALKKSAPYLFEDGQSNPSRGGFDGRQDIIGNGNDSINAVMNNAIRTMAGKA